STARREFTAREYQEFFTDGLFARVRKIFADAGRPADAEKLIDQYKTKIKLVEDPNAATTVADAPVKKWINVDFLPPLLSPETRNIVFPTGDAVSGIIAMKYFD